MMEPACHCMPRKRGRVPDADSVARAAGYFIQSASPQLPGHRECTSMSDAEVTPL